MGKGRRRGAAGPQSPLPHARAPQPCPSSLPAHLSPLSPTPAQIHMQGSSGHEPVGAFRYLVTLIGSSNIFNSWFVAATALGAGDTGLGLVYGGWNRGIFRGLCLHFHGHGPGAAAVVTGQESNRTLLSFSDRPCCLYTPPAKPFTRAFTRTRLSLHPRPFRHHVMSCAKRRPGWAAASPRLCSLRRSMGLHGTSVLGSSGGFNTVHRAPNTRSKRAGVVIAATVRC